MTEEFIITNCRHCNMQNRIQKGKAINNIHKTICGNNNCKKNIFLTSEESFFEISSENYEHPLDKSALNALKKVPGTGTILKLIIKHTMENSYKMFLMQNYIKVTPNHLIFINDLVSHASKVLDIEKIPEVYVYQSPLPNAFTYGVDSPYIGISTSLIDLLSEEELLGVIAHELGHIQCGHVLYRTAAIIILELTSYFLSGMLGNIAMMMIMQALLYWYRCSELSADRAELLVTKSFNTFVNTTMKLSGGSQKILEMLKIEEFLKQAEEAKKMKEENLFNSIIVMSQQSKQTHPFPIWRTGHLKDWVYDGNYLDILQGKYIKRSQKDDQKGFRENEFKKSEDESSLINSFKKLLGL
ncbi:MAG: M48 family metallopeptidase [Spirochaetota bacterium]|nr:M48 family metallopeptidase [Spirochaetota bacterium]